MKTEKWIVEMPGGWRPGACCECELFAAGCRSVICPLANAKRAEKPQPEVGE